MIPVYRFAAERFPLHFLIPAFALLLVLSGCSLKTDPPGEAPTGVAAVPGDGLVVISWDVLPDLTYWIFYQPGDSVDVATPNSTAIRRAVNPRAVTGLANSTQYAFAMNATHNDSAAGPNSTPVVAIPRLAGVDWVAGASLPLNAAPSNLRNIVFGGGQFVTVGDATTNGTTTTPTVFAGVFNYSQGQFDPTLPQGVNQWVPPTTPPGTFNKNLSSLLFNGSWVALSPDDGSIISSADGVNWSQHLTAAQGNPLASGMSAIGFAFAGGNVPVYVSVGTGGRIFVNPNGDLLTWQPATADNGTTSDLNSISQLNSNFWVTGAGGTLLANPSVFNSDGTLSTWFHVTSNTLNALRGIAFGPNLNSPTGNLFVAVGDAGTIVTCPGDIMTINGVNPGRTCAVVDPATFDPPFAALPNLRSVTVGGSAGTRFLAVGEGGAVVFSDDGLAWKTASSGTANLSKVVYNGGLYMAVGDAGANVVSR
jgi:hypothetical protein